MDFQVRKGEWIGMIGQRGAAGSPHTHLEVFEFFPEDPAMTKAWEGKGVWFREERKYLTFSSFGYWKRIEPTSLWAPQYYDAETARDYVNAIKQEGGFTQEEINKLFRQWNPRPQEEQ